MEGKKIIKLNRNEVLGHVACNIINCPTSLKFLFVVATRKKKVNIFLSTFVPLPTSVGNDLKIYNCNKDRGTANSLPAICMERYPLLGQ